MKKMKNIMRTNKNIIFIMLAILTFQSVIYIYAGNKKEAFHIDEYLTYQLSNGVFGLSDPIENGKIYTNTNPFLKCFVVDQETRFDYKGVWENQSRDVHPPFYYTLVHTVSSLIPGIFTKWIGIGINIFLALFVTILVYFITKEISKKSILSLIVAATFALSPGTINSILFIRMYVFLSIWVLSVSFLHLKYYKKQKLDYKFYVLLTIVSICGTLTQYYFLIFLFFICLFFGLHLIRKKYWQDVLKYCISLAISGILSIIIFPSMITQIFGNGYRGIESFQNLASSDFGNRLATYFEIIKNQIFGSRLSTAILVILILLTVSLNLKKIGVRLFWVFKNYMVLIFPVVTYFLLVVKISPYLTDRYVFCIYPFIWISFILIIYWEFIQIKGNKMLHKEYIAILIISSFFMSYSYKLGIPYMFKEEGKNIEISKESSPDTLLCIYDNQQWKLMSSYLELDNYNNLVFIPNNQINILEMNKYKDFDKIQIYLSATLDQDEIIQQILQLYTRYSTAQYLYSPNYGNVYQLQ
ncbi:hypothetical protein [Robinsoniella peoriensis]|uniref:hypothetical protein n=1 Tax=Robinsoniella peoriensis TaxID=180332 RepID=UPI00364296DC